MRAEWSLEKEEMMAKNKIVEITFKENTTQQQVDNMVEIVTILLEGWKLTAIVTYREEEVEDIPEVPDEQES